MAATMFCFGLVTSNFNAMAMEPLGHIAGTASSVQGFVNIVGGSTLGFLIGQRFDGTALPMAAGFAALGIGAIVIVVITERGRLFASAQAESESFATPPAGQRTA
jgi:DHA1 family bicyclomycin/chloramphenicol resistance-like MFS transporter